MPGALLDTHALYWLVTAVATLSEEALIAIANNQAAGTLYVSPITASELTIAAKKPPHKDPPNHPTNSIAHTKQEISTHLL